MNQVISFFIQELYFPTILEKVMIHLKELLI